MTCDCRFFLIPSSLALISALFVTPYLAVRNLFPRAGAVSALCLGGAASIMFNTAVPILFDRAGIPIDRLTLTLAHLVTVSPVIALTLIRGLPFLPAKRNGLRACAGLISLFALMVLPFTYLAGIDTYKWQGLATNVRVERCIPWLIHPLSLFGFTPRSYPSAQPLILATVEIMLRSGVDWGYYVVSTFSGALGILAAFAFGRRFFGTDRQAGWYAFLYGFSPVFVRYNHWATGRGLLLALLPLFLLSVLEAPRARGWGGLLLTGVLMPLAHKTGLVVLPLGLISPAVGCILPRTRNRTILALAALPFLGACLLVSPTALFATLPFGAAAGFAAKAATRFAWYIPLAVVGWLGPANWFADSGPRKLVAAALLSLPASFAADMYGALAALPFVTLAAAAGFFWLTERLPASGIVARIAATVLTLAGALVIVIHRSVNATPPRIRAAARFLESYDPQGPYDVVSPLRARLQIHAYVSGCPRFEVVAGPDARVSLKPLPPLDGRPSEIVKSLIDYGRDFVALDDITVFWYGRNPRSYYLAVDGAGPAPPESRRIYDRDGVVIREPKGQQQPGRRSPRKAGDS